MYLFLIFVIKQRESVTTHFADPWADEICKHGDPYASTWAAKGFFVKPGVQNKV